MGGYVTPDGRVLQLDEYLDHLERTTVERTPVDCLLSDLHGLVSLSPPSVLRDELAERLAAYHREREAA